MNKRLLARCVLLVLGVAAVLAPDSSPFRAAPAVAADAMSGQIAGLKDQLEKGLKARQPAEFDFVAKVVALVDVGRLPRDLVESTFLWARKKRPYPFPYFERGLKVRAAQRGIQL